MSKVVFFATCKKYKNFVWEPEEKAPLELCGRK
jgi:hypothetical protein